MSQCDRCSGSCESCGGCGCLTLTPQEREVLEDFFALPFRAVVRKPHLEQPLDPEEPTEERSRILQCLEKKALIDIDYHCPLKGYDYSPWPGMLTGSAALTARGQRVAELLDISGAREE